jgi:Carboxypeptidase regulatory-like domain
VIMALRTHKFGVDANRPIVIEAGPRLGAPSDTVAKPDAIAETAAAWVRLNFVLGPWSAPGDPMRYQGRTWAETYSLIIDQFRASGLNIYGLIGAEALKSSPDFFRDPQSQLTTGQVAAAHGWIAQYAATFGQIAALFSDRVSVFESFNEPDDWHGAQRHWIHPTWFAEMLEAIHRKVKLDMNLQRVNLITGPLQGLDANENRLPTQYLRDVYQYGMQTFGWGSGNRPYPFDGVGYHLYIKNAYNSNWADQEYKVRQTYRHYVDGMLRVIRAAEGPDTTRQLYISEIGWPSNHDTPEEKAFQAQNMRLAFELIQADPSVALAIWFCTEDFDPGQRFYGLYQMRRVAPEGRKLAFYQFRAFCERFGQGVIYGTLRDQAGHPQAGYQITLTGPGITSAAVSHPNGSYSFGSLPSGTHVLSLAGTGVSQSVISDGQSSLQVDLTLPFVHEPRYGVISGVLRDPAGLPQAGRTITLVTTDATATITTDAQGGYRFDGLAAGMATIQVAGTDLARQVWCNGFARVTLDLTLATSVASGGAGSVNGRLRDQSGLPQAGRQLTLVGGGVSRSAVSDGSGFYRFSGLIAGMYLLRVPGTGLTRTVWSDGQAPVQLDLTLAS